MIRLGPKGLSEGLKRIRNLLVEEISLVDKAATRRKFLLIKRDNQNKPLEVSDGELRRTNFMGFEVSKNLKIGETMEFERTEELGLPPDLERELKSIVGIISKCLGYKYKTKSTYKQEGKDEQEKEDADNERKNAKVKDKEVEEPEDDDEKEKEKKRKKDKDAGNAELSSDLERQMTELSLLVATEGFDQAEAQTKLNEIKERMSNTGGGN